MLEVIKIFIALLMAFLQQNAPTQQKEVEQKVETEQSIIEQKEESSKEEEIVYEQSPEEIVYEPSPEEIALSLQQDDYAIYIPDINCKVKVHECDTDEEIRASQSWVDLENYGADIRYDIAYGDVALEAYKKISFIADHSDQGFYGLWNLTTGAKAYIAKGSKVKVYELTKVYHAYMQYVTYDHIMAQVPLYKGKNLMLGDADIIMMTCAEDSGIGGRYITYWKELA